ncbi:MAG: hypothetical protein HC812_11500 [Leptolyngbya sp. RL_3_1]|nr:hypothetical protein [Leptolyngbya sp. RL_3_1]
MKITKIFRDWNLCATVTSGLLRDFDLTFRPNTYENFIKLPEYLGYLWLK